jgi:2-polyprenyl-3-methyl-5-hydroxy-6-metoxy-1,4-benzoquinol methylase
MSMELLLAALRSRTHWGTLMKCILEDGNLQPNRTLSPQDTMVSPGMEDQYFEIGRGALELVKLAGRLCDRNDFERILDLPCGHGRVLRWLKANYPKADITACDLDKDSVNFCRDQFGAEGVYSQSNLETLSFPREFDLVWCGSLLTHFCPEDWLTALDCLIRWTRDHGVIVFSTQGRYFTSLLQRGQNNIAENIDKSILLRDFSRDGHAFQPYFEDTSKRYGIAVSSPEFVGRMLQAYPGIIVRSYIEHAWGIQDIVILHKKSNV